MKWSRKLQHDKDPCISIIVPTLNEEKHIRSLLDSLKDQSLVSFETVVVDGGSKDKTSEIANKYDAKVVVLPEHGEFISRNIGADVSRGDLLLFTCADIVFPKDIFHRIMEKF